MASVGFRWLDILEKEFDKAFVDLDLAIGELDSEEPDVVFNVRQKLCTLSSCFAQLTHKSQTIFQNSAKIEAELIHMRAELVESKAKRDVLEQELHNLLLQLHSQQLSQLPDTLLNNRKQSQTNFKPDVNLIKKKLEAELINIRQSPIHHNKINRENGELKFNTNLLEMAQLKAENIQLKLENTKLRNSILSLNSEVYGAKLAAKYLDKELAGRIQQLQLLGREMRGDVRDKLWRQLESEILLQRHKTVVRACRRNSKILNSNKTEKHNSQNNHNSNNMKEEEEEEVDCNGDIRTIVIKRNLNQGLGISITGGREHGVPIIISELEPNGPAALSSSQQLLIGDAILFVNDIDLRNVCHKEAVNILQQQNGDCTLQVQYISADDDDCSVASLLEDEHFRFLDGDVCESSNASLKTSNSLDRIMNTTPTAPRTPESSSAASRVFSRSSMASPDPKKTVTVLEETDDYNLNNYNNNIEKTEKTEIDNKCDNLILIDNTTNNVIKLENFRKIENNLNYSTNSLNSDNFSSPMQTSIDCILDSETTTTNNSSPPSIPKKNEIYESNDSLSNPKSDQSLLNSGESCTSSPVQASSKKVQRKHKKNYFGVKTLQSIFNNGYSDVSSTGSGDEEPIQTTPQFEENIHNILSDIFVKKKRGEKYFSLHGQNVRVGKALRLCPNQVDERKEKLLARYVYNANAIGVDGVGDPDFGTPV